MSELPLTVRSIFYLKINLLSSSSFLNRSLMQLIEQVTLMMFSLLQGMISPQLGNIHVSNRIQRLKMLLISLFRANVIDYGNAFNLTKYLTNETDYIVWERVDSSITYVRDMLLGKALYPKFQVCKMPADSSSMCRAIKLRS